MVGHRRRKRYAQRVEDKDDSDSISLTSTTRASDDGTEKLYFVERILAEDMDNNQNMYYLIQWEGYQLAESTWEPEENIEEQKTFDDWNEEKRLISKGHSKPFDLEEFEVLVTEAQEKKKDRRRRRRAKRKRLGMPVSPSESDAEASVPSSDDYKGDSSTEAEEVVEEPADDPGIRRPMSKSKSGSKATIAYKKDKTKAGDLTHKKSVTKESHSRGQSQGRSSGEDHDESTALTSDDSLVGEILDRAARKKARQGGKLKSDEKQNIKLKRKLETTAWSSTGPLGQTPSLSKSVSPLNTSSGVIRMATKQKIKSPVEPPSRTGYQGTANRGRAVQIASSGTLVMRGRGRPYGSSLGLGLGRGRGRGRGRGAEITGKPSFTAGGPQNIPLSKTRSLANALLEAGANSPSKPMEHFKTPSMVRKAELAGRSLADRVPDFASVGPLINPSQYAGIRPIPKRSRLDGQRRMSESGSVHERQRSSPDSNANQASPTENLVENNFTSLFDDPMEISPTAESVGEENDKATFQERDSQPRDEMIQRKPSLSGHLGTDKASISVLKNMRPAEIDTKIMENAEKRALPAGVPTGPRSSLSGFSALSAIDQQVKPFTKIKFNDYKFRQIGEGISVKAQFGDKYFRVISIAFKDIDKHSQGAWVQILLGLDTIIFDRVCITQDFRSQMDFVQERVLADGSLLTDNSGTAVLDDIAFYLRPVLGLLFNHPAFSILLFPAKCEDWKFIESTMHTDANAMLRYRIFKSNHDITSRLYSVSAETVKSSLDLKRSYLESLVELTQGLQYNKLVSAQKGEKPLPVRTGERLLPIQRGQSVHNFYLLFPPRAASFISFWIMWLRASRPECRIFISQKEGSWQAFITAGTGTIILHESLTPLIFRLPNIGELLASKGGTVVWCVGSSLSTRLCSMAVDGNAMASGPAILRLFPHGGAVFLTPSFLIEEPKKTHDLLKWFQSKVSKASHGSWKLVTCYNVRRYLLDLAIQKASERENLVSSLSLEVEDREAIASTKGLSYEDCNYRFLSFGIVNNLRRNENVSDENDYAIIYADESIGQDNEKDLVTWFSGWSMLWLSLFRRFMVVGTTPSPSRVKSAPAGAWNKVSLAQQGPAKLKESVAVRSSPVDLGRDAINSTSMAISVESNIPDTSPIITPGWKRSEQFDTTLTQSRRASVTDDIDRGVSIASSKSGLNMASPASDNREDVRMDTAGDNSDNVVRARHRIDGTADISILTFIAVTGEDRHTAENYLKRNNNDLQQATKQYFSSRPKSQIDGVLDQDDRVDPVTVLDFSAGTITPLEEPHQHLHPSYVHDDVKRAIELYNEYGRSSARVDGSGSSNNLQPLSQADIASLRPSGPAHPEIINRPGYIPPEDKEGYKNRKGLEGVKQKDVGDMPRPNSTSRKSYIAQSPADLGKQSRIDSEPGRLDNIDTIENNLYPSTSNQESTTEWYSKLQAAGQGWEHIYVDGWEGCFKRLGFKSK